MKRPEEIAAEKEARRLGKQLARDVAKKLISEAIAIANLVNAHDERITREAKEQEREQIVGWLEDQKGLISGGSLSAWTDDLGSRLKALTPFGNREN